MRQFPLPQRHEELLNKAFGRENWHEDKQLAGFSGASVYQITYKNNPVVIKIAHPAVIQRERAGYHEFVLDNLRHHAPQLGEYDESDDRQEAILRYTYAGSSVAHSQTLFEFLERPSQKAVQEVCAILGKMFTLNQSDHPKSWWERAERKSIRCAEYYDRWLPVQLELEQLPAAVEGATLLQATKLSLPDIAKLTAGDFVQLQGFCVEKAEAGVVTLYVGRPQAPSLRVKVRGSQGSHEGEFPHMYAVVKETRAMLLEKYAEEAVGAFAMRSPHFNVDGHTYVNPFYYLDDLLSVRYNAYIATIHGDFNLRNILLEEKAQPAPNRLRKRINRLLGGKIYDWWLIDFASAQLGPILLDLQWLEAQVINWLLVPALQRAGQGPRALAQVLEGLHRRRGLYFHLRTAELRAIYTLLQEIHRLAENYLAEPAHNPERWQEYYRGLTLALAATLKQEALKAELGERVSKFALVAAATTVRWAGLKLAAPVSPTWPAVWRRSLAPLVAALCLGLLYYGGNAFYQPMVKLLPSSGRAPASTPTALQPAPASYTPAIPSNGLLATVQKRGWLQCGVNGELPRFSWDETKHQDFYESAQGFDADFCRVVAIAVFGTYTGTVKFKNLTARNRWDQINDRRATGVDLFFRNTTRTPDRDSIGGVDFEAINFYTRQAFLVRKNRNIRTLADLHGKRVCVLPNTTQHAGFAYLYEKSIYPTPVVDDRNGQFDENSDTVTALQTGQCDALTGDTDQLLAFLRPSEATPAPNLLAVPDDDYFLLPEDESFPLQPRGPVVPANDSQWRKVVSYAVWATIYAEQLDIDQKKAQSATPCAEADSPLICQQFLGIATPYIKKHVGEYLGLKPDFARNIIAQMGNYGEIYTRHLGDVIQERGMNQPAPQGLLDAVPFALSNLVTTTLAPASTPDKLPLPPLLSIAIGVAVDLQDKESLLGDNQEKAAKVAAQLYQYAVPGVEIKLEIKNTNSSTTGAQSAIDALLAKEVIFIVGPTLSSQARVIDPIANAQQVPIIGPSNTAKGIAQLGCYVSRISPPVTQLDPLAVRQAYFAHGDIRNVAVAYLQGNPFTEDEAQVFIEEATRTDLDRNWQIVATQPYTPGAEIDFTAQATNILKAAPDLVMIAGLTKDGGLLAKKLREQQYTGVIVGGNGFNTTGIFNVCQGACNGIIVAQAYDSRNPQALSMNQQFVEAYTQAYQSYPSPIAAQMFTAIQVGVEALKRIAERSQRDLAALALPVLRDELNKELLAGAPFADTPLGEIDFAADGEVIQQEFYVAQIEIDANGENGKFKTLDDSANEAVDALLAAPSDCPAGYLP